MLFHITQPENGTWRRGALIVQNVLANDGHDARLVRVENRGAQQTLNLDSLERPDAWMVSVLSHRDWWILPSLIDQIASDNVPIVIGGQSSDLMKSWADSFCDILAIGDIHSEKRFELYDYIAKKHTGIFDLGFSIDQPPMVRHKGKTTIYLASGCPRKCPYCRISHVRKYHSYNIDDICKQIKQVSTGSVNLYSPSGDHPKMELFMDICRDSGLTVTNTDYHPRAALRLLDRISPKLALHLGIEGTSERLRKHIKKPLSSKKWSALQAGRRAHSYIMVGLPTETSEDRAQLLDHMSAEALRGPQWYTVTPLKPIPGTIWGGSSGRLEPDIEEFMASAVEHGKAIHRDLNQYAMVAMPKSKALHECEVATMRMGDRTGDFLRAMKGRYQKWRKATARTGVDPDEILVENPLYSSHL